MKSKNHPINKAFFLLIATLLVFSSCKKESESSNNDNVFKYRDYVYYTTSGRVSSYETIKITLAKDVLAWEANQEIDNAVFSISPSVNGKLQTQNKRTLVFQPEEPLKSNTEYTVTLKLKKLFPKIKKNSKNILSHLKR